MNILDLPSELIQIIVLQSSIYIENKIPNKYPFVKSYKIYLIRNVYKFYNEKIEYKNLESYKIYGFYKDNSNLYVNNCIIS